MSGLDGRMETLEVDGARLSLLHLFSFGPVPVFSGELGGGREVLTYDFLTHFLPFHSTLSPSSWVSHTNSCLRKLSESHKFRLTVKIAKVPQCKNIPRFRHSPDI